MRRTRINQGKTFSLSLRIIISIFSISMMIWVFKSIGAPWSIPIAILVSFVPPAAWFSTKIFEIDPNRKKIFIGSWSMGFRFGKWIQFKEIEIKIQKARIKKTEFSLPDGSRMITDQEYQAILKTNANESFYLLGHPLKERIEEKIQTLRKKLELDNMQK